MLFVGDFICGGNMVYFLFKLTHLSRRKTRDKVVHIHNMNTHVMGGGGTTPLILTLTLGGGK
jgi:hypothetical protein